MGLSWIKKVHANQGEWVTQQSVTATDFSGRTVYTATGICRDIPNVITLNW
jgi:hypothetical protein